LETLRHSVMAHVEWGGGQCKLTACKKKIEKGEVRVGKTFPNDRFTEGGTMTEWFHAPCIFQVGTHTRSLSCCTRAHTHTHTHLHVTARVCERHAAPEASA
jgi:hypothetical protein